MTFYPYLARNQEESLLRKIKSSLLIIGTLASGGYFVFSFIVRLFIKKYIPSLDIISILFAEFPALIIINALYVNLYKVQKQERLYFFTVLKMLIITILLNTLSVIIYRKPQDIALATTISFYVWYVYSARHFKTLKINLKELIYLLLYLCVFFISIIYFSLWQGAISYLIAIGAVNLIFYSSEIKGLIGDNLKNILMERHQ